MKMNFKRFLLLALGALIIMMITLPGTAIAEPDTVECIDCHQKELDVHSFDEGCYTCHNNDMTSLNITQTEVIEQEDEIPTDCTECHSMKYEEVDAGDHGVAGFTCQTCHEPHPVGVEPEVITWKESISIEDSSLLCESCHPASYVSWSSGSHGDPEHGCTSCHDPHEDPAHVLTVDVSSGTINIIRAIEGLGVFILLILVGKLVQHGL